MSSAPGTAKIHTWHTLPGELPRYSPGTAPALPQHWDGGQGSWGSAAQEAGNMALGLAKSCNVPWRKESKDRPQRMWFL